MSQETEVMYTLKEGIDEILVYEFPNGISYGLVLFTDGTAELDISTSEGNDETLKVTDVIRLPGALIVKGPGYEYVIEGETESDDKE